MANKKIKDRGAAVIDANGECNINGVNFSNYQIDGLHPNKPGRQMYGRVFIERLNSLVAKIN